MKKNRPLLLLFVALAVLWTGWLIYMVKTAADPIVVSAPQLHYATIVVAAEVTLQDNGLARARISKVYKDALKIIRAEALPGELSIRWSSAYPQPPGPANYLLALRAGLEPGGKEYVIAPVPVPQGMFDPRVYPLTESVRVQTERILAK